MCTGGFTSKTSKTSKEALRCKAKYSAFDEIERLNKRIVLLENNIDDYKSKYIRASRELQEFKNANKLIAKLSENYPHLLQHINSLNLSNDSPKVKNGIDSIQCSNLFILSSAHRENILCHYCTSILVSHVWEHVEI